MLLSFTWLLVELLFLRKFVRLKMKLKMLQKDHYVSFIVIDILTNSYDWLCFVTNLKENEICQEYKIRFITVIFFCPYKRSKVK